MKKRYCSKKGEDPSKQIKMFHKLPFLSEIKMPASKHRLLLLDNCCLTANKQTKKHPLDVNSVAAFDL